MSLPQIFRDDFTVYYIRIYRFRQSPNGEKRFNKNSPWKWMLPSLEFPWQDFIRMTAEMQFAF